MSKKALTPSVPECMICAERFSEDRIPCVGSCDHLGICSICFLRLRALGKDMTCPMCKERLEQVICYYHDGKSAKSFSDFTIWNDSLTPGNNIFDHTSQMFFPTKYYNKKVEPLWLVDGLIYQYHY